MAGRGPARKLGQGLGAAGRPAVAPGDGLAKSWPPPEDIWEPKAIEWWHLVVASPSAAAWVEADRPKLERLAHLVQVFREMLGRNPAEAVRMNDAIRRAEEELYLSPKARASAGITVGQPGSAPRLSGGGARSRLRAVGDDVALVED